jgi:hypothetical protein
MKSIPRDPAHSHARDLLMRRGGGARPEVNVESLDFESAPHPDDVLQRVTENMLATADEAFDPDEYLRALNVFTQNAEKTLRKLERDPLTPLDMGDGFVFEAVIRTDGTRPTLLMRDDKVDQDHPTVGAWRQALIETQDTVRTAAQAIGRIEPANATASNFFGTGWLVQKDAATQKGIVLTNLHVLEAMWRRLPNFMIPTTSGFRVLPGAAFIDFAAESGSLVKKRFQIVEAKPSGVDGDNFARLDAAVFHIEPIVKPTPSPALPEPIAVLADTDGPQGNLDSFFVIGYPGPPRFTTGIHEGVDWTWVNTTLFGNRFGVKRLAPGKAHKPVGSLENDPRSWVFGHDATTLGGSSGSPTIAWWAGGGSFGLHFAGASVDTNCAHAIVQCRAELEKIGVPVQSI